ERLRHGAEFLQLRVPFTEIELTGFATHLLAENRMTEGLLRLSLSRGVGPHGYSPRGADQPFLVMTCFPAPAVNPENLPQWKLITSSFRVPAGDKISNFKTCNKLPQVMARLEAESAGANEALLLNTNGDMAEAASSNLFWIAHGEVCTTPLADGALAG